MSKIYDYEAVLAQDARVREQAEIATLAPRHPYRIGALATEGLALIGLCFIANFVGKTAREVTTEKSHPSPLVAQKIPSKLPSAVSSQQGSVVKVYDYRSNKNLYDASGSGVKIAQGVVLTAGHMILSTKQKQPTHCDAIRVSFDAGSDFYGQELASNWRAIRHRARKRSDDTTDVALMQVTNQAGFNKLPVAPTATTVPKIGNVVYFVNYQPADVLLDRSPNSAEATDSARTEEPQSSPAQYPGVVVGKSHGRLLIATGLKSYSKENSYDAYSIGGSSGGPVYNSEGEVFGIEDASYENDIITAGDIARRYGVKLRVSDPDTQVSLDIVQPTTTGVVKGMTEQLNAYQQC